MTKGSARLCASSAAKLGNRIRGGAL